MNKMILAALMALTCSATAQVAPDAAPVHRRLSVRRQPAGYAVIGFRAAPDGAERFRLTTGLTARQLARQIESVKWDNIANRLNDQRRPTLTVDRTTYSGAHERLTAVLTEAAPRGRVRTVTYVDQPARFSRNGLIWFLRSAFGRNKPEVDTPTRLRYTYRAARGPVTLTVDAVLLSGEKSKWRVTYVINDPRLRPVAAPTSTQPTTVPTTAPTIGPATLWPSSAPATIPGG